jgi:hypothetical protein
MSEFTLDPDAHEPELPRRPRRIRLVGHGLHPTEAVPESRRRGADTPPIYLPCAHCAEPVIHGSMADGTVVILDAKATTYSLLWDPGAARPSVVWSRAYVAYRCAPPAATMRAEDAP